ncbi:beta-lactamase/transpeptidase-like protein [Cubamyces menziesii]|nr:beta-lactamase/transpeptidase-like protein [Cubamyces menziesii]
MQRALPQDADEGRRYCRPFLPNVFDKTPPSIDHPAIRRGVEAVNEYFATRFTQGDIDSLSVAIVTSNGPLLERNFGALRANESNSPATTSHSMYRLASISKLFTALEGFVLEQKGIISWEDPVNKYLKDFKYRPDGLSPHNRNASEAAAPITLFQLASHMSGLGRNWPPGMATDWPHDAQGGGPPPINGNPFPSREALLEAIAGHHLVSPPWFYPSYSNTGIGVLGLALAAASSMAAGDDTPITHADLMKREVFEPLGLNSSHFLATDANRHLVMVPSIAPEVADLDFLDAMNPAGGQFSSLADMITLTETILDPTHPKSLLSSYSRNKWLRPVHTFEEDDWTEIGLTWEIIKAKDLHERLRKIYWKLGNVGGYHSAIAIHPGTSYGIVVLMAGEYPDTAKLVYDAFELLQPEIDEALADAATALYAGNWVDDTADAETVAQIAVDRGTLYIDRFVLQGADALNTLGTDGRVALRSTGWRDELRLDTGMAGYNGLKHMGCYPYWNGQDNWGIRNNAAINAIYFTGEGDDRRLYVPSLSLVLKRV